MADAPNNSSNMEDSTSPEDDEEAEAEEPLQGKSSIETTATASLSNPNNNKENESEWKDDDFLSFDNQPAAANSRKNNAEEEEPPMTQQLGNNNNNNATTAKNDDTSPSSSLPPWIMSEPPPESSPWINPLVQLHNEIVAFSQLMEPTTEEIRVRHALVEQVRALVHATFGPDAQVQVFGSLHTGLFLPTSDIDLVVTVPTNVAEAIADGSEEDEESRPAKRQKKNDQKPKATEENTENKDEPPPIPPLLHKLAGALRSEWLSNLTYLEVIENTRVPLVKFTHVTNNLNVDICFHQDKGVQAAELVSQYLQALPPLKPLTFCFKYWLSIRGLNEPYTGGVGSFLLQLMIVSYLQQRERESQHFQKPLAANLGAMLLEFLELFGGDFNYVTTGISVKDDGCFFAKGDPKRKEVFFKKPDRLALLAMENPLDPTMDVGASSFRMQMIQRSLGTSHKLLLAHLAAPHLMEDTTTTSSSSSYTSVLATILPPNEELRERGRAYWNNEMQRTNETPSSNNNK